MSRTDKTTTRHFYPKQPRSTIIFIVLNAAKTQERCILSITEQNYFFKELIILNGGSTDNSKNILQSYSSSINYWESETEKGDLPCMNKALKHATGE